MKLDVRTNFPQVADALRQVQFELGSRVLARTLNVVTAQAATAMSREIRQEFNLPASYVRERLRVKRAFVGGGKFNLTAELVGGDGKRRSANVIRFARGSGPKGVRVVIRKGKAKEIAGAFIGNKGRTVFRRVGAARLPIEPVRTIDVAQMFNTQRINRRVIEAIEMRLPVVFEREMRFALSRLA